MNRNDIDIRKGRCGKTDNVRFDEARGLHDNKWHTSVCNPEDFDNVIYLEHYDDHYYYYTWNDNDLGSGCVYRQRDDV